MKIRISRNELIENSNYQKIESREIENWVNQIFEKSKIEDKILKNEQIENPKNKNSRN